MWHYASYGFQGRTGVGNHSHRATLHLAARYEKHLEVETSLAQWSYGCLRFGKGFAYYLFLEKDMGRDGGLTAQRSAFLWLTETIAHLPAVTVQSQTSVQPETT